MDLEINYIEQLKDSITILIINQNNDYNLEQVKNLKITKLERTKPKLYIQMNIDNLNKLLSTISKTYQETLSLREQLAAYSNEQIIECIQKKSQINGKESGCVSREEIVQWVKELGQSEGINDNIICVDKLAEIFPFDKISYTVLITTCLKKIPTNPKYLTITPTSTSQSPVKHSTNPLSLLTHILSNQLQTNELRNRLIPLIQLYIPISGKNLTVQQLKDYLLLGNNSSQKKLYIDATYVILALNCDGGSGQRLQFQLYNNRKEAKQSQVDKDICFQNQESIMSMTNIRQIMNRLNKRVDNFGNQWLINRPQDKNTYLQVFSQQKNTYLSVVQQQKK